MTVPKGLGVLAVMAVSSMQSPGIYAQSVRPSFDNALLVQTRGPKIDMIAHVGSLGYTGVVCAINPTGVYNGLIEALKDANLKTIELSEKGLCSRLPEKPDNTLGINGINLDTASYHISNCRYSQAPPSNDIIRLSLHDLTKSDDLIFPCKVKLE